MSGLTNTRKRLVNIHLGRGFKTNAERRKEKADKKQAALDSVYANALIPDEEEVRRNERRKAAKRRGSRASTQLTDQDTLG